MAIMIVIVISVAPIIFKKNAATINFGKESGTIICSCNSTKNKGCTCAGSSCTFIVQDPGNREFYTVQLLGGGAGGGSATTMRGGGAGEAKVVYYPAMKGTYNVAIGAGGTKGNAGGQTTLSQGSTVLEYANGGITTNETASTSKPEEKNGAISAYSENGCGRGGNANASGTAGEVIIRW